MTKVQSKKPYKRLGKLHFTSKTSYESWREGTKKGLQAIKQLNQQRQAKRINKANQALDFQTTKKRVQKRKGYASDAKRAASIRFDKPNKFYDPSKHDVIGIDCPEGYEANNIVGQIKRIIRRKEPPSQQRIQNPAIREASRQLQAEEREYQQRLVEQRKDEHLQALRQQAKELRTILDRNDPNYRLARETSLQIRGITERDWNKPPEIELIRRNLDALRRGYTQTTSRRLKRIIHDTISLVETQEPKFAQQKSQFQLNTDTERFLSTLSDIASKDDQKIIANPNDNFWRLWGANKQQLKDLGIKVSKNLYTGWVVEFPTNALSKPENIKKLDTLALKVGLMSTINLKPERLTKLPDKIIRFNPQTFELLKNVKGYQHLSDFKEIVPHTWNHIKQEYVAVIEGPSQKHGLSRAFISRRTNYTHSRKNATLEAEEPLAPGTLLEVKRGSYKHITQLIYRKEGDQWRLIARKEGNAWKIFD